MVVVVVVVVVVVQFVKKSVYDGMYLLFATLG